MKFNSTCQEEVDAIQENLKDEYYVTGKFLLVSLLRPDQKTGSKMLKNQCRDIKERYR